MNLNHPTVELYFAFALTYCKLSVYASQEPFARRVLEASGVKWLTPSDNDTWQEIDTRVLLSLVSRALPQMLEEASPQPEELAKKITG